MVSLLRFYTAVFPCFVLCTTLLFSKPAIISLMRGVATIDRLCVLKDFSSPGMTPSSRRAQAAAIIMYVPLAAGQWRTHGEAPTHGMEGWSNEQGEDELACARLAALLIRLTLHGVRNNLLLLLVIKISHVVMLLDTVTFCSTPPCMGSYYSCVVLLHKQHRCAQGNWT